MRITIERLGWGRGFEITVQLAPGAARKYIVPDTYVALHAVRTIIDADEWQQAVRRLEQEEQPGVGVRR